MSSQPMPGLQTVSQQAAMALGISAMATALCGLGLGLLLLPQRLLQRPLQQGVVSLHLEPSGSLRLYNQPLRAAEGAWVLAAPRRRGARLRLIPDPATPWASVQRQALQLDRAALPLELQLPAPAGRR